MTREEVVAWIESEHPGRAAVRLNAWGARECPVFFGRQAALVEMGWVVFDETRSGSGKTRACLVFESSRRGLEDLAKLYEEERPRFHFLVFAKNVVYVDRRLAGRVIGRGGENIKLWGQINGAQLEVRVLADRHGERAQIGTDFVYVDGLKREFPVIEIIDVTEYYWPGGSGRVVIAVDGGVIARYNSDDVLSGAVDRHPEVVSQFLGQCEKLNARYEAEYQQKVAEREDGARQEAGRVAEREEKRRRQEEQEDRARRTVSFLNVGNDRSFTLRFVFQQPGIEEIETVDLLRGEDVLTGWQAVDINRRDRYNHYLAVRLADGTAVMFRVGGLSSSCHPDYNVSVMRDAIERLGDELLDLKG